MQTTSTPSIRERRARERWVWRLGLGVSLLLHAVLFLLRPEGRIPLEPEVVPGPGHAEAAASGGLRAVALATRPSGLPDPPPPVVSPTVEPVEPVVVEDVPEVDPTELLGERPDLEEPGGEVGRGGEEAGAGPGDDGAGGDAPAGIVPPSPRGMILPPADEDLRGSEISVWVFVDPSGQVVPDSTRLDPPTRKRDFNRRLIEEASEWVFEPAREDGEPVAAWFPYTIRM